MSCLRPKKGFVIGVTENGKDKYKITSYLADHVELVNGVWRASETSGCSSSAERIVYNWIPIPCGKCLSCKAKYARDWTCRLLLEKEKFPDDECFFLTLTYKNEELPLCCSANDLGEVVDKPTLRPRDMVLFWKRVRKDFGPVRIFYCGEYGSVHGRPHYHAIVFGLKLDDLKPVGTGKNGDLLYHSDQLSAEWYRLDKDCVKHDLGFLVIGRVTAASCAYVARYCMKKAVKKVDPYVYPEFIRMSRRPGIASEFVDRVRPLMQIGDQSYMPSRYFLKLLEKYDPGFASYLHDQIVELGQTAQNNLSYFVNFDPCGSGRNAQRYLDYCRNLEYNLLRKVDVERSDL